MPSVSKKQARFELKFRKEKNGCWSWIACKKRDGRGRFSFDGHTIFASKASWLIYRGNIPPGLWILHHCDNPSCVNPSHLFLGTHQDNMDDCKRKGRNRNQNVSKTHCRYGHSLTGYNLYLRPDRPSRGCKTCRRNSVYHLRGIDHHAQ